MIKIKFLDGKVKEYKSGVTLATIAQDISKSLSKKVIAGYVDDELYDLTRPIEHDAQIRLIEIESEEGEAILNHSAAHLLAQAITRLYPSAKFGVGPNIENGFYYDFKTDETVKEEDIVKIEKEMRKIVSEAVDVQRKVVSKKEALKFFKKDKYKTAIINDLDDDQDITLYTQGEFTDLCRGVHVPNTKMIKNFKLLSLAGAYWRGDSNNEMLQRIYGVAKPTKEALEHYLHVVEEGKKRDHRKLGKELNLFMFSEYGPGFPFFLPHGMILRNQLEAFWRDIHEKDGYQMIQTPIMLDKDLWEVSGHWFNYRENMYTSEVDKHEFVIKPMNCPGAMMVYDNTVHSYKEFPLRFGELGLVHRHEASGALHGLFRVRSFTQDDGHIFMMEEQIESEIIRLIKLYDEVYSVFDLSFEIELSTRPENYIGEVATWDLAEEALAKAITNAGYSYKVNPGDGAFYGPKLDFKLKDSLGRIWQCGTIQLDNNLPERFDLTYIASDGTKKRPILLHRACLGSIERFIGILIEHYAGAFPTWLAPEQVRIIPVNKVFNDYTQEINDLLLSKHIRTSIDERDEKLSYLIRDAQVKKIPYQLVIGEKEVKDKTITYRKYGSQEQVTLPLKDFVSLMQKDIKNKGKK